MASPDDHHKVELKKGRKRRFDELAARDLSRVFFHTLGKEALTTRDLRVQNLNRVNAQMEKRLHFLENILPPCVTARDLEFDDLYCSDCDCPLTCMDYQMQVCLRDCSQHSEMNRCCECDASLCDQHKFECFHNSEQFCNLCLMEHSPHCVDCRQAY